MSSASRDHIRTPLIQRWHHFRQQVLPVICFIGCVCVTLWLWQRQARLGNGLGAVQATQVVLRANMDGYIDPRFTLTVDGDYWTRFDQVAQGQIVARLDDRPLKLAMDRMRSELSRIGAQVEADRLRFELDYAEHQYDRNREVARLTWQSFDRWINSLDRKLDVLDRRTQIQTDTVELQRMESLLTSWQPLNVKGVITDVEYEQQRLQSATIREKIAEARKAYDAAVGLMRVADGQKTKVEGQLSEFTSQGLELPDLEQIMSPLKQAIAVQEKAIAELDWQIQTLDIKSPVTGQVVEVHVLPGQSVRAGDPIVTIAAQGGQFLESYVRQDQRVQPVVGMRVKLRARRMGSRMVESEVDRVGSQVVAVPLQHLSDPATPEWGVPVRIRVPEELGARPGELIEITYPMR